MVICIECGYPVRTLYTTYSKADDKSLGKGVRLTQCPRCKQFADKYVEHDFVVLFIDLVLIKPQVYRHLLFNRLGRDDDRFDPSIIRLGVLLLLFDVYLTWARIEKASPLSLLSPANNDDIPVEGGGTPSLLSTQPLVLQYLFFLALVFAETLAFHLPMRLLCLYPPFLSKQTQTQTQISPIAGTENLSTTGAAVDANHHERGSNSIHTTQTGVNDTPPDTPTSSSTPSLSPFPYYPHPTPLSTALLVSSCTKLFPILLIIWDYDLPSSASAVSWAVIVNNVAALEILMDCGYMRAAVLVAIGAACRACVAWGVLSAVGLGEAWGAAGGGGELEGLMGWGGWLVRNVG